MPVARGSRVPAWPMWKGRGGGLALTLGVPVEVVEEGFWGLDWAFAMRVAWVWARRGAKRVEVWKVDCRVRRRVPEEMFVGLEMAGGC